MGPDVAFFVVALVAGLFTGFVLRALGVAIGRK